MKRNGLLKLLEEYSPSPDEIRFKDEMIEFAKKNENCFERSLLSGHFTASAWLLNKDKSKAFLMHHVKLDVWCQSGGHCDGDPDLLRVAVKEAKEESGISAIVPIHNQIFDIDIHPIPAFKQIPPHFHYDVRFLLQVTSDEEAVPNPESKGVMWVGKNPQDLPTTEPSILRIFNKWVINI